MTLTRASLFLRSAWRDLAIGAGLLAAGLFGVSAIGQTLFDRSAPLSLDRVVFSVAVAIGSIVFLFGVWRGLRSLGTIERE